MTRRGSYGIITEMPDIFLICTDCSKEFFFKEKDQEFYLLQGYENPKRCWDCRQSRKQAKLDRAATAAKLVK